MARQPSFRLLYTLSILLATFTAVHSFAFLPWYIDPDSPHGPVAYAQLYDSITAHPALPFKIVINPASGPGNATLPSPSYMTAVSRLNALPNVELYGYIATRYGAKDIEAIRREIDIYAGWAPRGGGSPRPGWNASAAVAAGNASDTRLAAPTVVDLRLHGFFFDEVAPNDDAARMNGLTYDQAVARMQGVALYARGAFARAAQAEAETQSESMSDSDSGSESALQRRDAHRSGRTCRCKTKGHGHGYVGSSGSGSAAMTTTAATTAATAVTTSSCSSHELVTTLITTTSPATTAPYVNHTSSTSTLCHGNSTCPTTMIRGADTSTSRMSTWTSRHTTTSSTLCTTSRSSSATSFALSSSFSYPSQPPPPPPPPLIAKVIYNPGTAPQDDRYFGDTQADHVCIAENAWRGSVNETLAGIRADVDMVNGGAGGRGARDGGGMSSSSSSSSPFPISNSTSTSISSNSTSPSTSPSSPSTASGTSLSKSIVIIYAFDGPTTQLTRLVEDIAALGVPGLYVGTPPDYREVSSLWSEFLGVLGVLQRGGGRRM